MVESIFNNTTRSNHDIVKARWSTQFLSINHKLFLKTELDVDKTYNRRTLVYKYDDLLAYLIFLTSDSHETHRLHFCPFDFLPKGIMQWHDQYLHSPAPTRYPTMKNHIKVCQSIHFKFSQVKGHNKFHDPL